MKDIVVTVGTRAIIHPQLAVGRIEATITVTATTPLVDTAVPWSVAPPGAEAVESRKTTRRSKQR